MDPTEVLKAITDIAEALRADVAKIGEKCDSVVTEMAALKADRAKRKDNDNDDDAMARRTAADSIDPAAFAALSASVAEMRKRQSRPTADLNAFADVQAKADAVFRTHNERADAPMHGEDLVSYKIRTHRPLQKHSTKWKGVDASQLVCDHKVPHRGDERLFWDENNLQTLRKPCHDSDKQRAEQQSLNERGVWY